MPPTLTDIARETRTSISTVSRVLAGGSNAARISQATRGKVMDAADKAPAEVRDLLAPYLDAVHACNPDGGITHYPGSPMIARKMFRKQDRLTALELLMAGIQAYIFTMLTCMYLNDALHPGH